MTTPIMEFESCTPKNIANLSDEEVLELAKSFSDYKSPIKTRLLILKKIYQLLGFNLSNDLALALTTDVKRQLILACAGGCKTTSSQIIITLSKILWSRIYGRHLTSSEILCLVYNRENRPQMDKRHAELLTPLVTSGFLSYDPAEPHYINAGVTSHTLHSFCKYWIEQYLTELGRKEFVVIKEEDSRIFFNSAVKNTRKKFSDMDLDIKIERIQTLYDLVHGLCLNYDAVSDRHEALFDAVCSCNATVEQIKEIFKTYDNQKLFFKRYDFTDMLSLMNKLLDNHEIRSRMHSLYTFILVDEVQDFTPLMITILKKLVGEDTRLLAIGDEDQSIYSFRGADINNVMRFTEHFADSKVFQLLVNRRCGENILSAASSVIECNQNRYPKKLVAERTGGKVHFAGYHDLTEQLMCVADKIMDTSRERQSRTVICVREKVYGQPFTFYLYKYRIPFHTLNTRGFQYHEVFRAYLEIMNLLWKPARDNWRNLYKVVNIKKADWFSYIGFNEKKCEVENFSDKLSLWDLNFKPFIHYSGLKETLLMLQGISQRINSEFCREYIDYVLGLIKKNFWETRISINPVMFSDEAFEWIHEIFAKNSPYPVIFSEYSENISRLMSNQSYKSGVAIATMHALKGLEFEDVHMVFLDDLIFPSFMSIDAKNYPANIALTLKEAENRLAYVAMTRARDNLYLHYNSLNPSIYVKMLTNQNACLPEVSTKQLVFTNRKVW